LTNSPLSRALRTYRRRAMSRLHSSLRSRRRALLLAPLLAAASSGAHAVAIEATVDTLTYTCSEADYLQVTVEDQPIWSWQCGIQQVICVQAAFASEFNLDTNTLHLECFQLSPHPSAVFFDSFEDALLPPG